MVVTIERGFNESFGVLDYASIVNLLMSADPELDYSVVPVFVEFPAGSSVGDVECANISISTDGLVEADESFSVLASNSDTNLNPVQFVGDQSSVSPLVEVIIQDDDGNDTMHQIFCVLCFYT